MFTDKNDHKWDVVQTSTGVRVDGVDFTLGEILHHKCYQKVMSGELHVYTVCFEGRTIGLGLDYDRWKPANLSQWLARNDMPMDQWIDDDFPENYEHEGKIYQIRGAERSWPLPEIMLDGEVVGHLDSETDTETGATKQVIRWV